MKYDSSGNLLWNSTYSSGGQDIAKGIALSNSSGSIYVTGTSSGNILTIKYNSSGGVIWTKAYTDGYSGNGVVVDENEVVYVGGATSKTGVSQFIIIKYDSNGNELFVKVDSSGNRVNSIARDSSNNIYVTGKGSSSDFYTVKYRQVLGPPILFTVDTVAPNISFNTPPTPPNGTNYTVNQTISVSASDNTSLSIRIWVS